jgi:predicted ATP-grasp superfamily ATP-dependent carboligase
LGNRVRGRQQRQDGGARRPAPVDVLVLDGALRQSLVSVRRLGEAGLRVGVADRTCPPASASKWCAEAARVPDVGTDGDAFFQAVQMLVEAHRPRALLVAHDGTIEALRRRREALATRLALASEPALEIAIDKERTYSLAQELGLPCPRTIVLRRLDDVEPALDQVRLPAVVKPGRSWVTRGGGGRRLQAVAVGDVDEAVAVAAHFLEGRVTPLLQEWVGGRREAVSLIRARGEVVVRFAQIAHRMVPPLGGASVMRESIPLPSDTTEAAEALAEAMGLEGYAEVEFRRDRGGRPLLMEVNPRLSASVEVAVRAGVDFPLALYRWSTGDRVPPSNGYRVGVRMRWLGGDIHWLLRTLGSQGKPDSLPAHRAAAVFARDFFRRSGYDYLVWSDLRPAFTASRQFIGGGVRKLREGPHVTVP